MKKDSVLISSVTFSAVWHIFWLSILAVVVVPHVERPVKFSNVAFLGPILDRGILSVNVGSQERSAVEKEFFSKVNQARGEIPEYDKFTAGSRAEGEDIIYGEDDSGQALAISYMDDRKSDPGREL